MAGPVNSTGGGGSGGEALTEDEQLLEATMMVMMQYDPFLTELEDDNDIDAVG